MARTRSRTMTMIAMTMLPDMLAVLCGEGLGRWRGKEGCWLWRLGC